MKRKSILCVTLAAALAAGSLAGCGTPASESSAASADTTSAQASAENGAAIQPCEVTFWHAMTGQQETTLTELTDQFNAENEYGIQVTLVNQGSYNDLSTKLTANAAMISS